MEQLAGNLPQHEATKVKVNIKKIADIFAGRNDSITTEIERLKNFFLENNIFSQKDTEKEMKKVRKVFLNDQDDNVRKVIKLLLKTF